MSLRSTLSPWAWAASLTCLHRQLTIKQRLTRVHTATRSLLIRMFRDSHSSLLGFRLSKVGDPRFRRFHLLSRNSRVGVRLSLGRYLPRPRRAFHQRRPSRSRLVGLPLSVGKDLRQHRQGFRQHRQGHQLSSLQPQALLPSVPFPRRLRQAWAVDLRVRRASAAPARPCRHRQAEPQALQAARRCTRPPPALAHKAPTPLRQLQAVSPPAFHRRLRP